MVKWSNWSGGVEASPRAIVSPRTEEELGRAVERTGKARVVGAGHSFTPLCATDGDLISLQHLPGSIELSACMTRARVPAGWSISRVSASLWQRGFSLPMQGDLADQSIGGALATGTHGSGEALGTLAGLARSFRLMLANGSIVNCGPELLSDLFEAQRLSLGMLGIALNVEIDIIPAYRLMECVESHPLQEIVERWDELVATHRHIEAFVFPHCEQAFLRTLQPALASASSERLDFFGSPSPSRLVEILMRVPFVARFVEHRAVPRDIRLWRFGPAHLIFSVGYKHKFEEMEYQLPRAMGWHALAQVIDLLKSKRLSTGLPFQVRVVAGDDIWLSPFNRGQCISISMHRPKGWPLRGPFAEAERIFLDYGGRPHWAKRHTLSARDIRQLYPKSARFSEVCQSVDPAGKFANRYLAELFDLDQ